jgi:proton-coupled amino acid transporter
MGQGTEAINKALWLDMIGFSVYAYEGIGVILPIMDITEKPEQYPKILMAVLVTVMVSYVGFGWFCYFIYGNQLVDPLITANLPKGSPFVWIIKIAFCFNLVFTYPLVIYPANMILESYIFGKMPKSKTR